MSEQEYQRRARWLMRAFGVLVVAAVLVRGCTPAPAWAVLPACDDSEPGEACVDTLKPSSGLPAEIRCKAGRTDDEVWPGGSIRAWCCFGRSELGDWRLLGCVPSR